jgi:hypothetical protein
MIDEPGIFLDSLNIEVINSTDLVNVCFNGAKRTCYVQLYSRSESDIEGEKMIFSGGLALYLYTIS